MTESIDVVRNRMKNKKSLRSTFGNDFGEELESVLDGIEVEDVHSDSRRVGNGSLFVAIPGSRENGEKYAAEAVDRGASVVVTENEVLQLNDDVTKVCVSNARMALAK